MENAYFKVDTKLASLLGESYRSTEVALKELIDNAWDADASNVWVTLPEPLTQAPLIIKDDGSGMIEKEVREQYLYIANSRQSRKGERTATKNRKVKGRKGIGKFSGLAVAENMRVLTKARGKETTIDINKGALLQAEQELDKVKLPIEVNDSPPGEKGTTIRLTELNENFSFPDPEKFKQLLMLDYGRENDFNIFVNEIKIGVEDIKGDVSSKEVALNEAGPVKMRFAIADKAIKNPGIAIRVDGKLVGKPTFFGLENDDTIPQKLLKRIYGEVEADGLADGHVTADWGAIFENSKALKEIHELIQPKLKEGLKDKFKQEVHLAEARLQKKINRKLEQLPENRRAFAARYIKKVIAKFYDESEEKQGTIISVVLDSLERDEYFEVLRVIEDSSNSDVENFSHALAEFGLLELASISRQASNRMRFLDYLDKLIDNDDTLEKDIHEALEHALWVFGMEYSLVSSNQTLKGTIKTYCDKSFKGDRANKRPDLLLGQKMGGSHLVVEFKRPNHTLNHDDKAQAEKYRADLAPFLGTSAIEIIIIGGKVGGSLAPQYIESHTKLLGFRAVISNARYQLEWLLQELEKGL